MTDTPSPSPEAPAPTPVTPVAPAAVSPSTPSSPATTPTPAPTPAPQAARPEYIPEAHWDPTANKVRDEAALSAHFNEIIARDAAAQSQALSRPQTPDAYKIELPADFAPPAGVEFKFNTADPLLAQARTVAHENGLSQEGFSKLLGIYAGTQVSSQQAVKNAHDAEIAKLGTTGPARVTAVETVFKAVLGEAEGKQLTSRLFTAADVMIAEKLVAKLTGQGTFKQNGRVPPEQPGKVTQEQYDRMSQAERWNYSRSHDQKQFQTVPGGRQ